MYDQTCGLKLFTVYVRPKTSQLIVYIIALQTTRFYLIISQATNYFSMKISIYQTEYLDKQTLLCYTSIPDLLADKQQYIQSNVYH